MNAALLYRQLVDALAEKPWAAAWRYTSHRSVQVFKIGEEVFGGTQRLVRVLPSQAANSHISEVGGFENNDSITKLLHAANAHPRTGQNVNMPSP